MAHGISSMQHELLRMGLDSLNADKPVVRFQDACKVFFPEFEPALQIYCRGDSPENMARANSTQAAVSRALRRLEARGLVERLRGHYAGYRLTLDGTMEAHLWNLACQLTDSEESGKSLTVNSPTL